MEKQSKDLNAICILQGTNVSGVVRFRDNGEKTKIKFEIKGLKPGKHGFHVHEFGDLSNGCVSAGAHFNPFNLKHGGPDKDIRHVGDLGNIIADSSGIAIGELEDSLIKLSGINSVIGRAMIVHEDEDDLGDGDSPLSSTTGNAGARLACGIIAHTIGF